MSDIIFSFWNSMTTLLLDIPHFVNHIGVEGISFLHSNLVLYNLISQIGIKAVKTFTVTKWPKILPNGNI